MMKKTNMIISNHITNTLDIFSADYALLVYEIKHSWDNANIMFIYDDINNLCTSVRQEDIANPVGWNKTIAAFQLFSVAMLENFQKVEVAIGTEKTAQKPILTCISRIMQQLGNGLNPHKINAIQTISTTDERMQCILWLMRETGLGLKKLLIEMSQFDTTRPLFKALLNTSDTKSAYLLMANHLIATDVTIAKPSAGSAVMLPCRNDVSAIWTTLDKITDIIDNKQS